MPNCLKTVELELFARWLAGSADRAVSSTWRPTIQRLSRFQWQGTNGVIRFAPDAEIPQLPDFVPGVIRQKTYEFVHPETRRRRTRRFPQPEKKDTAAELAYILSSQGPVLVFCTQPGFAEGVCKALLNEAIESRRLMGEPVHPHFDSGQSTRSLELAQEWLGTDHIATRALSRGVALHHGRLPGVIREGIEADCRAGRYRVIVATNTLAQGVNLPVKTVIVHSTWRGDESGERSRIPVRDYWNIAGRAGQETEGLIIHLTLTDQDLRDFNHYSNLQNLEPVRGALFRMLEELTSAGYLLTLSRTLLVSWIPKFSPLLLKRESTSRTLLSGTLALGVLMSKSKPKRRSLISPRYSRRCARLPGMSSSAHRKYLGAASMRKQA